MRDRKDFASSLFFLVLGLFLFFQSGKLSFWSRFGPEEGFFPLAIAVIITGISLVLLIQSLVPGRAGGREEVLVSKANERIDFFRIASYGILTLLYGFLMETAGFLLTTAVFLFLILRFVERRSWKVILAVTSASIIISYLLFKTWLGVPLPRGFMKGWNIF